MIELGVYDVAELLPEPRTGDLVSPRQRLRDLVEQAELAEQVGLDVYGLGEHRHRCFVGCAPAVGLAAIAARTHRIRLTSATTVLTGVDPVRVFQDFATLDLLSDGRAEIMAGAGPLALLGLDSDGNDDDFGEKLDELLRIRDGGPGRTGPAVLRPYPRPVQEQLPIWVGACAAEPLVRAGRLGAPASIAVTGGALSGFASLAEQYRAAAADAGHPGSALILGVACPGFVAARATHAVDAFRPHHAAMMAALGRLTSADLSPADVDAGLASGGALLVGAPEQVAEKILTLHRCIRPDRVLVQISVGGVPHHLVMRAIELFGTEVAPMVRREL